jgi:hypothetical protein
MMQTKSVLSDTYYSLANIEYLQGAIQSSVAQKTSYKIGRQNDADLYNLMRKVYADYMRTDFSDISNQVSTMNAAVVSSATNTISNGIIQNLVYLRDISTTPVPPDIPRSTSTHGLKLSRY